MAERARSRQTDTKTYFVFFRDGAWLTTSIPKGASIYFARAKEDMVAWVRKRARQEDAEVYVHNEADCLETAFVYVRGVERPRLPS